MHRLPVLSAEVQVIYGIFSFLMTGFSSQSPFMGPEAWNPVNQRTWPTAVEPQIPHPIYKPWHGTHEVYPTPLYTSRTDNVYITCSTLSYKAIFSYIQPSSLYFHLPWNLSPLWLSQRLKINYCNITFIYSLKEHFQANFKLRPKLAWLVLTDYAHSNCHSYFLKIAIYMYSCVLKNLRCLGNWDQEVITLLVVAC